MKFNRKILHALILMSALFLSLVGYLTYFQLFKGPKLANSGSNPRSFIEEDKVMRGEIYDRNGTKLAYSEMEGKYQNRIYPYKDLYAHVIGYNNHTYGSTMIEDKFNGQLMGKDFINSIFGLKDMLSGEAKKGANLTLTVDHQLQSKAYELLGKYKGAVVAIDPESGQVLAMVSKPSFDPNTEQLKSNWEDITADKNTPLLPRALSGLYPPGSSFKIIIASVGIEKDIINNSYEDTGSITISGKDFTNYGKKVYGNLDANRAFAVSCNTYFIDLADRAGEGAVKEAAEKFLFNNEIEFDLSLATSSALTGDNPRTEVAAAGMGQGDVLATPFQMALVASAVANDGIIMRPYIVDFAKASNGAITYKSHVKSLPRVIPVYAANQIKEMMKQCVLNGTGTGAAVSGVNVYGKTGTAENAEGKDHAWFVCFAEYGGKKIALSILAENAGVTGSDACTPIARELIKVWKNTI